MSEKIDFRKWNRGGNRPKRLSEHINIFVTPTMSHAINKQVNKGHFPNTSEFVRHLIAKYLDETGGW